MHIEFRSGLSRILRVQKRPQYIDFQRNTNHIGHLARLRSG